MVKYMIHAALWVLLYAYAGISAADGFYRWTDQSGSVLYSYTHPGDVDYVKIDAMGNHIERVEKIKPEADELVAHDESTMTDHSPPHISAADETRKAFLANAYINVDELTNSYQRKIASLRDQDTFFREMMTKLSSKVEKVAAQLSQTDGLQKMNLEAYIENTQQMIEMYEQKIVSNKQKQAELDLQYLDDKSLLTDLLAEK